MQIAERINNRMPINDAPYYNQQIHDYLIENGAQFTQVKQYKLAYVFEIDGKEMRLLFSTDLDQGNVRIQYWWEEEDDEMVTVAKWLTHYIFSIPVGPDAFRKFKQILNAYIESL